MPLQHLLTGNDVERIVDATICNYENRLYIHKLNGDWRDYSEDVGMSIFNAIEKVLDEPGYLEYSPNLRFLILLAIHQEGLKLRDDKPERFVSNYEYQLYLDVLSELGAIYSQFYRRNIEIHNDEEDDDWNTVYVDANKDTLDDELVETFAKSFDSGDWEPFKADRWSKGRFRPFAVVAVC